MSAAIDRYRAPLIEMYRKDFERHVLTDEGDGRWLCRRPDESAFWFRVITAPGTVIVVGDIGEQVLRVNDPPIPWLRSVVGPERKNIDYQYFTEKCTWKPKKYLPELASEYLDELEAGDDDPEPPDDDPERDDWAKRRAAREEQAGAIRDAVNTCDDDQERAREFHKAWYETTEDSESPDPTDWDSETFLVAEALRCFVRLLDERTKT